MGVTVGLGLGVAVSSSGTLVAGADVDRDEGDGVAGGAVRLGSAIVPVGLGVSSEPPPQPGRYTAITKPTPLTTEILIKARRLIGAVLG
jgi:hypothetical protein